MDAYVLKHLDRWLDHVAFDDERDGLRAAMIAVLEQDQSLVDLGWPRVREIAEGR